jgi:phage terminase large subunit
MTITRHQLERLSAEVGELVKHRDAPDAGRDFSAYRDDPVGFWRGVLGWDVVAPGQVLIAERFRDNALTAVQSCNGYGKDWTIAGLAIWCAFVLRCLVIITGPTERQVREIVMGYIRRMFLSSDLPGDLFERALWVDRAAQAGILVMTSSDASKLTGFHAPRLAIFITEAQGVEDYTFEAALACATGEESRILAVGNPISPTGRYYHICRSVRWNTVKLSAFDHTNVIEGRDVIPGAVTRRYIDMMVEEYGPDSPVYAARVLGEFPTDAEDVLCKWEWLDAAAERWRAAEGERRCSEPGYMLALDVARFGTDETVLAIGRAGVLHEFRTWAQKDTMETTGRVVRLAAELESAVAAAARGTVKFVHETVDRPRGVRRIVVDEVGLGGGVVDRLREMKQPVVGFNGGRSPSSAGASRFLNMRAESFWQLRRLLERGEIALPPDEKLFEELSTIRWSTNSSGKIQLESKDLTRATLGRSPDRADAAAMMFYRPDGGRQVRVALVG